MIKQDGYYLAVISSGRPHAVQPIQQIAGKATWYVPPGEVLAYMGQDATKVVGVEGLVGARNLALEDAFAKRVPCVQLDDDLRKLTRAREPLPGEKKRDAVHIGWAATIAVLAARCAEAGAHLAGVAPTTNLLFASPDKPLKRHHFCVGDLLYVLPTPLRFDPQFRLKEDYDYTLQHLATYGCVARSDDILAHFLHRTNTGGAVAYRTPVLEDATIAQLQRKWPGHIVPNPRRPHEVLLRWPVKPLPGATVSSRE